MTELDARSDGELATSAQAGEKRAFDHLVTRHKGSLFRFVRRYVGNDDDAYDIVQDTFISAWLALARYRTEKTFPTWLRAIALNKCRDSGRRQAVRRRFLRLFSLQAIEASVNQERDAEHQNQENQRLARLDQAIAGLAPFYKEPLLLTTIAGLSHQEAAVELNTTAKAIEMRIRRAKTKLSEALPGLEDE